MGWGVASCTDGIFSSLARARKMRAMNKIMSLNSYGRFNLLCPFYNRETEGGCTYKVGGAKLWNRIPLNMRKKDTAGAFKNALKNFF